MRIWLYALPVAATLAGCGTIDQAPLIYASTVRVGIGAESGTPQVPGAKVMIGVDATDAAMVPVAYGRTCVERADGRCKKDDYPITEVTGHNDISPAEFIAAAKAQAAALQTSSDRIRDRQRDVQAAADRRTTAAKALEKMVLDQQRLTELQKTVVPVDGLVAAPVVPDPEIARLTAAVADLPAAQADKQQADAALVAAQTSLDTAYVDFATQPQALTDTLTHQPTMIGKRADALSVFGSFNADASAKATDTGAGIKLGKSFSTGIAAQLLTEGLKQAASSAAANECLKTALTAGPAGSVDRIGAIQACTGSAE